MTLYLDDVEEGPSIVHSVQEELAKEALSFADKAVDQDPVENPSLLGVVVLVRVEHVLQESVWDFL